MRNRTCQTILPEIYPAIKPNICANTIYVNRIANNGVAAGFLATTGWSTNAATNTISGGKLLNTASGAQSSGYCIYSGVNAYASGKKIYVRIQYELDNAVAVSARILITATGMSIQTAYIRYSFAADTEYADSAVFTLPAGGSGNFNIQFLHSYTDATAATNKVLRIKKVMVIDQTADNLSGISQAELDSLAWIA
ncbi:MAG: hypothetical protein PHO15_00375 [Eubacteriales bacterium]|nr:hypothetical protein [Eubacteriales bacterium]